MFAICIGPHLIMVQEVVPNGPMKTKTTNSYETLEIHSLLGNQYSQCLIRYPVQYNIMYIKNENTLYISNHSF